LFICSRNRKRSLTAERVFSAVPGVEVRSAGAQPGARGGGDAGHIGWAGVGFAMERGHLAKLRERFAEELEGKRGVVLHIPDDYEYMQAELIDELEAKVAQHLELRV